MGKHGNFGLKFHAWPATDQEDFDRVFLTGSLLSQGAGSRLSRTTKRSFEYNHGYLLGFVHQHYPERLKVLAFERLTREILAHFIAVASEYCTDTTIGSILSREYYLLKMMYPEADLNWLKVIQTRARKRSKPSVHRQTTSLELASVGQSLLDRARGLVQAIRLVIPDAATLYRDGLMIKLLAHYPIRRTGLAGLEVGRTLIRVGDMWCIYLAPELVKTRKSQQYLLSQELSRDMDEYLNRFRPIFPQSEAHNWVWLFRDRRMGDKMIRRYICRRTDEFLGYAVTPHRFRNAAATFISMADPANIRAAKDLLGHRSFAITERHYIDGARSMEAGNVLANTISEMCLQEGDYRHPSPPAG